MLSASSSGVVIFGISSGFVIKSTDSPLQPFRGVEGEVGEGVALDLSATFGDSFIAVSRLWAFTLAKKSAS